MGKIRGQSVILYEKIQTGKNGLNQPIFEEVPVEVQNVLVGEPSTDDITSSVSMYGKKISYVLGIPKGDSHNWKDAKVIFVDGNNVAHTVKTFGFPITGIIENYPPLPWNQKVRCEEYG